MRICLGSRCSGLPKSAKTDLLRGIRKHVEYTGSPRLACEGVFLINQAGESLPGSELIQLS